MNKTASPTILTFSPAPHTDLEPTRRLIILVPGLEADLTVATQRVWELAEATGSRIKFLGLCSDAAEEPGLRRELVTMSAMVNYDNVSAEAEVILGRDWAQAVKSRVQPGDMVVCFDERHAGLSRKPLSQILQSELDVPLYILSGLYPLEDPRTNWPAQATAWIGFLLIILGFFILQVKIYDLANNMSMPLVLLSTAVEFWMILAWNNLHRRNTE